MRTVRLLGAALLIVAPAVAAPPPAVARSSGSAPRTVTAPARRLTEKDINLDEANRVAVVLAAAGIEVQRTRSSDTFVALDHRVAMANDAATDLFVSVHNNSSSARSLSGTEVYSQVRRNDSIRLAGHILTGVSARAGTAARGVFQRSGRDIDYYAVLRNARMPAVIVEGGYLSNPRECARLAHDDVRTLVAAGIAAGVLSHLGALPDPNATPVPDPAAGPLGQLLDPPGDLVVSADRTGTTVAFDTSATATAYRVWRDGEVVRTVRTLTEEFSLLPPPVAGTGRRRVTIHVPAPSAGVHRYDVRALLEVGDQVLQESPSATAVSTLPWRVTIDAGHGGRDHGATGRC